MPKFEGPFKVLSRPTRTTVEVKIGAYKHGEPRSLTYHWTSCKPAHMREGAAEGRRPMLGRKPRGPTSAPASGSTPTDATGVLINENRGEINKPVDTEVTPAKIQNAKNSKRSPTPFPDSDEPDNPTWSPRPGPGNCNFGPVITREMFDQWTPEMLDLDPVSRPVRTTRNANPKYVDALAIVHPSWSSGNARSLTF